MSSPSNRVRRALPLLGTFVEIDAGGDHPALQRSVDEAFAAVERVHRLMSFHEPESDVSRLNLHAHREAVEVAADTATVLRAADRFARASGGAFDITVAPQLVDWGYLPARRGLRAANDATYRDIELLPGNRVAFSKPLLIDLGGIAKGYAVDCACEVLQASGIVDYVVNAGGDLRVGSRPEIVRVRHPAAPGTLLPLITLSDAAVATSASYFAAKIHRGSRVHPLVVPGAARSAPEAQSVSVVAADCMTSDALTKVVALLGEQSWPILREFGAEACVLTPDGRFRPITAAPHIEPSCT